MAATCKLSNFWNLENLLCTIIVPQIETNHSDAAEQRFCALSCKSPSDSFFYWPLLI